MDRILISTFIVTVIAVHIGFIFCIFCKCYKVSMHAEGGHLGTQRHLGIKQGYLGIASEVAWTQKEMRSSGEPCDVETWKRDCPNFFAYLRLLQIQG